MQKKIRIKAFYPNFFGDKLISYVSLRLLTHFNDKCVHADIMGLSSSSSLREFKKFKLRGSIYGNNNAIRCRVYFDAIPFRLIWALIYRIFSIQQIRAFAEWRYFLTLRKGDIAYLWPGVSLKLYQKLHAAGYLIVSERINTLLSNSKHILDAEYFALGLVPAHELTEAAVNEELACMELSSYIFSPSPGVTESILEAGLSKDKVLQASYGLEEHEIFIQPKQRFENMPITAIFVGTICIRKGIHLLLNAWEKANVKARLLVVGRVSSEAEEFFKLYIKKHPEIQHVDFTDNLESIYREADFFILPSLEEGSPLVSYLALGASIPLVVSPMGAGGIIEEGKEGFIVDPHNIDELARAIKVMVTDNDLRARMAIAAGTKASYYKWEQVAIRRREALLSKLNNLNST